MGLPYLCNCLYIGAVWHGQMKGIFGSWVIWLYILMVPVALIGLAKYRYCRLLRFLCINPLIYPFLVSIYPGCEVVWVQAAITLQTLGVMGWAFQVLRSNTRRRRGKPTLSAPDPE